MYLAITRKKQLKASTLKIGASQTHNIRAFGEAQIMQATFLATNCVTLFGLSELGMALEPVCSENTS